MGLSSIQKQAEASAVREVSKYHESYGKDVHEDGSVLAHSLQCSLNSTARSICLGSSFFFASDIHTFGTHSIPTMSTTTPTSSFGFLTLILLKHSINTKPT